MCPPAPMSRVPTAVSPSRSPDGLYSGSKTATVTDFTSLTAANIKAGTTIFGVSGTGILATGNATAADVLSGVTFSSSSAVGIAGTRPAGPVFKTGQTTSYAAGDDGAFQKGLNPPSPRFTDNANGTVTDNLTGLIWLKNANAFSTQTWATALTSCNTLASGAAGLSDGSTAGQWRLPNVLEIQSLLDFRNASPALPTGHPFTNVQSGSYWSSSTYATATTFAWYASLNFITVNVNAKTNVYYVWPVRGGQ